MSRELLSRPSQVVNGGLSLAGLTDGILSAFNHTLSVMGLDNNLVLDEENTLHINDYPTFATIQDTSMTAPSCYNVSAGTAAMDTMNNNSYGNTAVGNHALYSMNQGYLGSALGFYAGSNSATGMSQYDGGGNTFLGALAGVTNICSFDDGDVPPFYGAFNTYVGAASYPSSNVVMAENVLGFMSQGRGQGTTVIGNALSDMGTLMTNAAIERFTYVGNYNSINGYNAVPFSRNFNININWNGSVFYVPHAGIYKLTLRVKQTSATTAHNWSLLVSANPGTTVDSTALTVAVPATGKDSATDLYNLMSTSQAFYLSCDYTDGAAVPVDILLLVEFVSLFD